MMRIAWIGHPSEIENDISQACKRNDIQFTVFNIAPHILSQEEKDDDPYYSYSQPIFSHDARAALFKRIVSKQLEFDLIVFRYPYWFNHAGGTNEMYFHWIQKLEQIAPTVVWCSEQGPSRRVAMNSVQGFQNVAVNNRSDILLYKEEFPDKNIFYMPSGTTIWTEEELSPLAGYGGDILVDGSPHYRCLCNGDYKRTSVMTMVIPLLDKDISVFGAQNDFHGWTGVEHIHDRYKGKFTAYQYPRIYPLYKVYSGITWNWDIGGFGIKLGRVFSTGIPIVWHRTNDALLEGFEEGVHLEFSSSPGETVEKVTYLLEHETERKALGKRGQAWAREHWEWSKNLRRLLQEIRG